MLLGRFPLAAGFGHRRRAGMAADLEVTLPLGVFVEGGRELRGPIEEHRGIGDPPFLEGEVGEHEIGLGITGKLHGRLLERGPCRSQLVRTQPEHRHHHAGRRQLRIAVAGPLQDCDAPVEVAVAKPLDRTRDLFVLAVIGHSLADEGLRGHLGFRGRAETKGNAGGEHDQKTTASAAGQTEKHGVVTPWCELVPDRCLDRIL